MRWIVLSIMLLMALVGCERPQLTAFRQRPVPLVISVKTPVGTPVEIERQYASALRAQVATLTTIVPEGVAAPQPSASLNVTLVQRDRSAPASPGAVGTATGMAVGALSALSGNRGAIFDGFFWGLFAGQRASASQQAELSRLGYRPAHIRGEVELVQSPGNVFLLSFGIQASDVIDAMRPLMGDEAWDEKAIREEESKALAMVIARELRVRMQWMPLAQPSWYGKP